MNRAELKRKALQEHGRKMFKAFDIYQHNCIALLNELQAEHIARIEKADAEYEQELARIESEYEKQQRQETQ